MALRLGFLALLAAIYLAGAQLTAHQAAPWMLATLMAIVFIALVAAMYLRVLPALLALPILAFALASLAGMDWKDIFSKVLQDGGMRLSGAILAAIMGSVLAQVVEKTGIAQTAIKKTAELGGDRPMVLAVLLTIVVAILFTTLGGLGAVIMVATIVIPILLSLGLRPLYVGCLFLLAMSLGGAFNLVNWQLYESVLGLKQGDIIAFALPFALLMLVATAVFMGIEAKRMGKARFKAALSETAAPTQFVPWYALLTPIIPLVLVVPFAFVPKFVHKPAEVKVVIPAAVVAAPAPSVASTASSVALTDAAPAPAPAVAAPASLRLVEVPPPPGFFSRLFGQKTLEHELHVYTAKDQQTLMLPEGKYAAHLSVGEHTTPLDEVEVKYWTTGTLQAAKDDSTGQLTAKLADVASTAYDFPIVVALLIGVLYGAITTYRRGQSTVQLLTKSAIDGVAAVGPALMLMVGIGMVLIATTSKEVSTIISPVLEEILPHGNAPVAVIGYVVLFTVLAPLALYRGPLNQWGMGSGLMAVLSQMVLKGLMPAGAVMGAFMSVGMIQGVCDPTNTHNVWVANYTNTDVQDILKRTLPYMWVLAFLGLVLSAVLYYGVLK